VTRVERLALCGGILNEFAGKCFTGRVAAFICCIFLVSAAHALDPNLAMSQYLHEHWGPEQGFPQGPVYAISQTADGYLWIGTQAGLFRFDGFAFRAFKDDSGRFTIANVLGLAADREGCLWVRLQNLTIVRYCKGAFDSPSSDASAIGRTSRGEILIARFEQGAYTFRSGGFRMLVPAAGLSRTPITAVAQTANGDVWMGTRDAGVFRIEEGKTSPALNALHQATINCLLADGGRGLWIGTDDGIVRWDGGALTAANIPASFGHFQALSMERDRDANLWVGTDSQGLLRLNSEGVVKLSESDDSSPGAVTAVFEDREGNLWIGSAHGLERLRDRAFVTYSLAEGLPADGNKPVFVDSENRVWFPPVNGGLWWVKGTDHGRVSEAGLERDIVYSIAGRDGELWLGRQHGGLTRLLYATGSFSAKTYTRKDGLAQDSVYSVYQTRDGSVWAGTLSGGASKLTGGKLTTYTIANGLASNTIFAILESQNGTTWFGTPSGLNSLSNGHWETYTTKDGLPSTNVSCLLEDSNSILWIGTAAGLAFRDSSGFHRLAAAPASLQESIFGLAEDKFGWLWISTSGHVLRVKRDALLRGTLTDGDLREFGVTDGLRGVEGVNRNRSVVTDPLGRIWFSLNRGISSVDPARLAQNSVPAITHLMAVTADDRAIAPGASVRIPGGSKRVTFSFIGLSLSSPDRVRFRYQLEGYEYGWSQPSAAREAGYTNLPPGSYRFRVMASNPDGVWSSTEAAIQFRVDPLYWQTPWFRLIVVLMCVLAIAALYRMRLHQLNRQLNVRFEERLAERTRIARDLHDTLLQSFQGLMLHFQVAHDELPARPAEARKILENALDGAAQAIAEGRDAVQGLRSSTVETNDLAGAIGSLGAELAGEEANSNHVESFVNVEGAPRNLHPIRRDEIYRIAGEALRNAFRHAHASRIEVTIRYGERQFRLRVGDDGKGIDPKVLDEQGRAGHWGLPGMRERAELIGGQLEIWSQLGSGTQVELSIPASIAYATSPARRFRWFARNRGTNS
jgi:signal transduction histidine kinase/ligand-binding sensor domain-containing protein